MSNKVFERELNFLTKYHNNLPGDWLFDKRQVVARLLNEFTSELQKEIARQSMDDDSSTQRPIEFNEMIIIRVSKEMKSELLQLAQDKQISLSDLIREIIKSAIENKVKV